MAYRAPASSANTEPSQIQLWQFGEPIPPGTKVPPQRPARRSAADSRVSAHRYAGANLLVAGRAGQRTRGGDHFGRELDCRRSANLIGSVDVSADRMVVWTTANEQPDIRGEGHIQSENTPLEIYMEGNVVLRQGNRIVQSQAMYFDVNLHVGLVLNAEILTPLEFANTGRPGRPPAAFQDWFGCEPPFCGKSSKIATSRRTPASPPAAWAIRLTTLHSATATYVDKQHPVTDIFGNPVIDPRTGEPRIVHEERVTGYDNVFYGEGIPFFYLPYITTDLKEGMLLEETEYKTDEIFGNQLYLKFNAYQLFGIRDPVKTTSWTLSLDELGFPRSRGGHELQIRSRQFLRHSRPHGRIGRRLLHSRPRPRRSWPRSSRARARGARPRPVVGAKPRAIAERLATHHRNRPDLRPQLPRTIHPARMGHAERRKHRFRTAPKTTTTARSQSPAPSRVNEFFTETSWLPRLDHFWNGQPLRRRHVHLVRAHQSRLRPARLGLDADRPDRRGQVDAAAVGSARRIARFARSEPARARFAVSSWPGENRSVCAGRSRPLG